MGQGNRWRSWRESDCFSGPGCGWISPLRTKVTSTGLKDAVWFAEYATLVLMNFLRSKGTKWPPAHVGTSSKSRLNSSKFDFKSFPNVHDTGNNLLYAAVPRPQQQKEKKAPNIKEIRTTLKHVRPPWWTRGCNLNMESHDLEYNSGLIGTSHFESSHIHDSDSHTPHSDIHWCKRQDIVFNNHSRFCSK